MARDAAFVSEVQRTPFFPGIDAVQVIRFIAPESSLVGFATKP